MLLKLYPFSYRTFNLPSVRLPITALLLRFYRLLIVYSQVYSQIVLITGHIIISEPDESAYKQRMKIRVWNVDLVLEMPVKPSSSDPNFCELDNRTALVSESIYAGGSKFFSHHLSAHASPLQDGLYIIWFSAVTHTNGGYIIIIRKYYLSPIKLSCHHKASQSRFPSGSKLWFDRGDAAISYAGHMGVNCCFRRDSPDRKYEHGLLPLGDAISNTDIHRQEKGLKVLINKYILYKHSHFLHERPLRVIEVGHATTDSSGLDVSPQLSTYSGVLTYVAPNLKDIVIDFYE
jgi:hypothetical protein